MAIAEGQFNQLKDINIKVSKKQEQMDSFWKMLLFIKKRETHLETTQL